MTNKSQVRITGEKSLVAAGITPSKSSYTTFVDKSQSGHRVKFAYVHPTPEQLIIIRSTFAALNPENDTRVWIVEQTHSYAYGGVALKVFNN